MRNEPTTILAEKQSDPSGPLELEDLEKNTSKPELELLLVFLGLAMAVLLAGLDQTIVATALPKIASDFGAVNQVAWVATAYMLTATACQPLYGKFSDIFGRKIVFLFAIIIFEVGSALCGASKSMTMLIVSRAISGIGGGGIEGMVFIIITEIVPLRERGKYQGFIGATFGIASVLGPLLGGIFTDDTTWRWSFYVNLPIGALTVVIVSLFLRLPTPTGSFKEKIRRIDFLGTALLLACIITLLLPTEWGGGDYPWSSPRIISLYCVSGVLLVAFIVVEYRFAAEPIIPCRLFGMRNPLFSFIAQFFFGMAFFGLVYYVPMYFQVVRGDSATTSGLQMLPMLLSASLFSIVSGFFISKTGVIVVWCWVGSAVMTVGVGLLTIWNANTSHGEQIGFLIVVGAGAGCCIQTLILAAQSEVSSKDMGVVTTMSSFFRSVGGVLGIAICGSIYNNQLVSGLSKLSYNIPMQEATNSFQFMDTLPAEERLAVMGVYVHVLRTIFYIAIGMSGLLFLFSLGIKYIRMQKRNSVTE
ncbi:MFS general substrate transporter [Basidiobolus meristosporus CBS 931.73]|uniref:MFS general substrate transporter n=1 Tax=Basidiobolus meristosporus CBS 931.73 TaxID=1314790 RepID=A0A1Y1XZR0_9FUNG|nr:MFS general substrate transporter [Basidiobolus meristosporus CBS 931.73]|eukprot:ORX90854.1 MFS general substrate transporter [Basidiobolus meristosporus CBS 931.73]